MRTTHILVAWLVPCGHAMATGVIPAPAVPLNGGTLPGPLSLSYGSSALTLGSTGTLLGAPGASVVISGPNLDGTAIRATLTGTTYSVPAGVSLVRFTQTATISAQTISLPSAVGDTHPIEFDNYSGTLSALTFSPAVLGWVNGSALPSGVSLKIRWDAIDTTWHRIG